MNAMRAACCITAALVSVAPLQAAFNVPIDLSGLTVWLDGDDVNGDGTAGGNIINGNQGRWEDKSGLLHSFTTAASVSPTTTAAAINGRSVVTFGAGSGSLFAAGNPGSSLTPTAAYSFDATKPYTVFMVERHLGGPNNGFLWTNDVSNPVDGSRLKSDGQLRVMNNGTFPDIGLIGNGPNIIRWENTATSSSTGLYDVELNGVDFTAPFMANMRSASTPILQVNGGGAFAFTGDMAEFIIYERQLSHWEYNQVGYYLQQKWGISGTYFPEPGFAPLMIAGVLMARRCRRAPASRSTSGWVNAIP